MFKVIGELDEVREPEVVTYGDGKSFEKQEVIVCVEGKYANWFLFELSKDNVGKITQRDVGRKVEVGFYINGRKGSGNYSDRVFLNLRYAEHSFIEDEPAPDTSDADEEVEEYGETDLPF